MKKLGLFLITTIAIVSCFIGTSKAAVTAWTSYPFSTPLANDTFLFGGVSRNTNYQITASALLGAINGQQFVVATAIKTGNYNANPYDIVICDTTSGSFTVTFPTAPANGSIISIKKIKGSNPVLLQLGGSDVFNIAGGAQTGSIFLTNQGASFQYASGPAIFYTVSDDLPLGSITNVFASLASANAFASSQTLQNGGSVTGGTFSINGGTLQLTGGNSNSILYLNVADNVSQAQFTAGKILIGNALGIPAVQTMSGDATLATNGALTLANTSQARTDLGLGSSATFSSGSFLQGANNFSDVGNAATALINLNGVANATNLVLNSVNYSNTPDETGLAWQVETNLIVGHTYRYIAAAGVDAAIYTSGTGLDWTTWFTFIGYPGGVFTATQITNIFGSDEVSAGTQLTDKLYDVTQNIANVSASYSLLGIPDVTQNYNWTGNQTFSGFADLTIVHVRNGGASQVVFDSTSNTNADQFLRFTGSPYTSGAGVGIDVVVTNNDGGIGTLSPLGYRVAEFDQLLVEGNGGQASDIPMVFAMVANQLPKAMINATGGGNYMGLEVVGNTVDGFHFILPHMMGVGNTNRWPINNSVVSGGMNTNIYFHAKDGDFPDFDDDEQNGLITINVNLTVVSNVAKFPIGIATSGTNAAIITATGFTNLTGTNIMLDYDASSSTITNFNSGGIPWRTNTSLTGSDFHTILQPGAAIKASGGLSGGWTVF